MRLVEESDLSYPVILCQEVRILNGKHRVCKAELLGLKSILAVRFLSYIEPDFVGDKPDDLPYQ